MRDVISPILDKGLLKVLFTRVFHIYVAIKVLCVVYLSVVKVSCVAYSNFKSINSGLHDEELYHLRDCCIGRAVIWL